VHDFLNILESAASAPQHRVSAHVVGWCAVTLLVAGCASRTDASDHDAGSATTSALHAPSETTIPSGPLGDAIRRGKQLLTNTKEELPDHVGNGLHCTSCHLNGGTVANAGPWVGIVGEFPEYRSRAARVSTLEDRINECFERSMNGTALDPHSNEMAAIISYMTWLSKDSPVGHDVASRGFKRDPDPLAGDSARGKTVYTAKCASCHGDDGAGKMAGSAYLYPALWGDKSFNIGSGMGRLETAAAFVRWNMPLGQGGTLSAQDTFDVAKYFTEQARPDFAGKSGDWPKGDKPRDARY
jgi:thiosulfate dehydrogenase